MDRLHTKDMKKYLLKPNVKINLKLKMIGLISFLLFGIFVIMGLFVHYFFSNTLEEQMGERVLNVAQSVSRIPELRAAFDEEDPASVIQPIVEPIREDTGAEFIVVGNTEEIRYAHPLPDRLGKRMVGDDNERALIHGESYVSKAVGSLGPSLRGKVPVFADDGEIIGVVSVGFLVDDIQSIIGHYMRELEKIKDILLQNQAYGMTAVEVGEKIGASRSTARRYLEYLVSTQTVKTELKYGNVGRPERYYIFLEAK